MVEYKCNMGPSAPVLNVPAFFIMRDELETDEQKAKRSYRADSKGDSIKETDMDKDPAKIIEQAKKREANGRYQVYCTTRMRAHRRST